MTDEKRDDFLKYVENFDGEISGETATIMQKLVSVAMQSADIAVMVGMQRLAVSCYMLGAYDATQGNDVSNLESFDDFINGLNFKDSGSNDK